MALVDYIADDLRQRIAAGSMPSPLPTLYELSGRYDVSMTPVRQAIERLVDEKVLERQPSRRLTVRNTRKPARSVHPPRSSAPTGDEPYNQIAKQVIEMSLAGDESFLREEKTAAMIGVSRPVIRQALSRLSGEGFVQHIPRRGWKVRAFRQDQLDAFTQIRAALEREALMIAWDRIDLAHIQRLLKANRVTRQGIELDNSLHAYLIETADNSYIRDFFALHGRYYALLFDWEAQDEAASKKAVRQHRAILKAILDRDLNTAAMQLDKHIRDGHPALTLLLKKATRQAKRKRQTDA